ncbi:MAG: DUF3488 and transglutaminase-like domain-containing protein [Candidatus Sedimenticola sp. (ex Thyasira tokunagai)]
MKGPRHLSLPTGIFTWLVILTGLAAAPHFAHLDLSLALFFTVTLSVRLLTIYRPDLQPGRILLFLFTLAGFSLILYHYPLLFGRRAGVAMLTVMLGLKLLELRKPRDLYLVVFLGFFTLTTQFLFNQQMLLLGYSLLVTMGLVVVLVDHSRSQPSPSPFGSLKLSLSLLLQAAPIMVVLFLFFPRLSGPLWNLGLSDSSATTGLSDSITPGSISELIQSRAVAFRVDFNGPVPPPQQRYWRGPVLWNSDGWRWEMGNRLADGLKPLTVEGERLDYSVTLEPSSNPWIYALNLPTKIPPKSRLLPDFHLVTTQRVNRRYRYDISSQLSYNTGPITPEQHHRGLQLPNNISLRMRKLVAQWRQQSSNNRELVNLSLNHYRQQPFYYTLYPPLAEENPVDQFLFDSRRGFCEHYATSFVTLMRLAGIPARVVTGYQGGEVNPIGGYLIVRQSDAHAWAEVWLKGLGWVRTDPTAAVAPERVERPFDFALGGDTTIGIPVNFGTVDSDLLRHAIKRLRLSLDAVNASWHRWVLGYSDQRQGDMMRRLGLEFLKGARLAAGMIVSTSLLLLLIALLLWYRGRERLDPLQVDYQRFCKRLQKKGIQRRSYEGPKDYSKRVIHRRPDLQTEVGAIIKLYIELRYGEADTKPARHQFHRLVGRFHP